MQKNILVTGSKGQLGRSLSKITKANNAYNFVFIDKEEADITSKEALEALFSQHKFFAVLHFAAYTAVDRAESEPETCELVNHKATEQIAKLCNQHSSKLLYISTDYVFDGTKPSPYMPTDKPNPLSVYGTTKLRGEQAVLANCKQSIIIRTSWLYSEFGNNFVKTMRRLGSEKDEIGVVFDQVGSPCYATDLAKV
ncbi:MAG: dTDP-4-dehydrorhamnose reductase, partial [Candidatus Onthomorpha sp.]|nr:dTDP-4-dehydrorhamnose reductase [Candidatus Onthomorpha sp.]